jgi:hypothetical protein
MYCHRLIVRKGQEEYDLHCEDLPVKGGFTGVWIYKTKMPESHRNELITILASWADHHDRRLKIYTDREECYLNMGNGRVCKEKTSPSGESLE